MNMNQGQRLVAATYADGEFGLMEDYKDAEGCDDTLFLFLMQEAGDAEDLEEFLEIVDTARDQLDGISRALVRSLCT